MEINLAQLKKEKPFACDDWPEKPDYGRLISGPKLYDMNKEPKRYGGANQVQKQRQKPGKLQGMGRANHF